VSNRVSNGRADYNETRMSTTHNIQAPAWLNIDAVATRRIASGYRAATARLSEILFRGLGLGAGLLDGWTHLGVS
jgi:hypothetical protein